MGTEQGTEDGRTLAQKVDDIERLLADSTDERVLADRIAEFGISADMLAKALASVEKSQRELVLLKRKTSDLERDKASSTEVDETVSEMRAHHQTEISRVRSWAFSATVVALGLLGATVFAFTMYAKAKSESNDRYAAAVQRVCIQRSEQSKIMGKYLTDQMNRIKDDPKVPAAQKRLAEEQVKVLRQAFPNINCASLTYR